MTILLTSRRATPLTMLLSNFPAPPGIEDEVRFRVFALPLLLGATACAQISDLNRLTARAGIIFAGQVVRVQRVDSPATVSLIRVTFRVDRAIRGVRGGQLLTINQWFGVCHQPCYRAGEHVLLFLYTPNRAGITSPIGGDTSRLSIDRSGNVSLTSDQARLFSGGSQPPPLKRGLRYRDFVRVIRGAR